MSRVLVLPVPYEATTSYVKGTARGPSAIIEASSQVEFFDEMRGDEPCRAGIHTLPPLDCRGTPGDIIDRIAHETSELVTEGRFILTLGGEHSLTAGCVEGVAEHEGPMTVVQIDAHADLRDHYEGSPWSHACVMRRIAERHPIVQVGIRSLSPEETGFIEDRGIVTICATEVAAARGVGDARGGARKWIGKALDAIETEQVYLTVDLDGFDPSIMPAVGTPEPGGLLWFETLSLIESLFERKEVIAADIVELCPIPGFVAPDFLAARLAYKIAGHALRARPA